MAGEGREVFDAFPEWVKVTFYVLAAATIAVFALGVWLRARRYWRARRGIGRFNHLIRRAWDAVKEVTLVRSRIWRHDRYAGIAHDLTLWGFGVLFLGTVILTVDEDVLHLFFGFRVLTGAPYLVYSLVLDLFGILLLVGIAMLIYRRARGTPRLRYGERDVSEGVSVARSILDDRLFLSLLVLAGIAGFLAEGIRIYRDGTGLAQEWSPVGVALAWLIGATGASDGAAFTTHMAVWWIHAVGALALVAYIPYSKALHMLAGFGSLAFHDENAGRRLEAPAYAEPGGFARLSDFSWAQLLHLDACVRCGRCDDACPAKASGLPISPRGLILELKSFAGRVKGGTAKAVVGNAIEASTLWSCATCMACMDACPLRVEHVPLIVEMRRYLVAQGALDAGVQRALEGLSRYGNSFGKPARARAKWTPKGNGSVRDARKEAVEYLWFVGDFASYDPRLQQLTAMTAATFAKMGLDFGIMHEDERNSGNDIRRVGEEGLFTMLRDANVEALNACRYRDVVTTDPHTYNTLRNEYPNLNGGRVLHYTELLDEMIRRGRLRFSKKLGYRVTYHDPCYLGRYNGVYDAPRNVLKALGAELVEMPRNRCRSFCCGAGGGRVWMTESSVQAERPADLRVKEAAALDGVGILVVACPKDYVMFLDAVKSAGAEDRLVVKDLIELVEEAL